MDAVQGGTIGTGSITPPTMDALLAHLPAHVAEFWIKSPEKNIQRTGENSGCMDLAHKMNHNYDDGYVL